MRNIPIIGIVGGVGPFAGLDLNRKIFDNTVTDGTDQDHLEVILFSAGNRIPDRTEFLLGRERENPAEGIFQALSAMEKAGASLAAIACNTAHSDKIFLPLQEKIRAEGLKIRLVDMIEETAAFIRSFMTRKKTPVKVGLLATEGTIKTGVYERLTEKNPDNLDLIIPSPEIIRLVHRAIYDTGYGIKACSNPVTSRARQDCEKAVRHLADRGAEVVILGCTELPLALPERYLDKVLILDPTEITARALIRFAAPDKLKNLD